MTKMKNKLSLFLLGFVLCFIVNSCSDDDDVACPETFASMIINGELKEFQVYGRGINIREKGHALSFNLGALNEPVNEETDIFIVLAYKKTGENIIEFFQYKQRNLNSNPIIGDFVNGEFENVVTINTPDCFSATFSGRLNMNGEEFIITDGVLDITYDESFDAP